MFITDELAPRSMLAAIVVGPSMLPLFKLFLRTFLDPSELRITLVLLYEAGGCYYSLASVLDCACLLLND